MNYSRRTRRNERRARLCPSSARRAGHHRKLEYIGQDNPLAARRVREELLTITRALVPFPNQGHKRPDLTTWPLRFTLVREYLIAYAPEEKPLWVVTVMHVGRSPRVMAAILRGRK
jgi:plasmid stabilization system protein ParE